MHWAVWRAVTRSDFTCRRLLLCVALALGLLVTRHGYSRAVGAGWQVVSPSTSSPAPRSQYGMAADQDGHLYLYGGNTGQDVPLGDFWTFDTAAGNWQALPNDMVPPLIEPHLAVDAQGNVWEFGGITSPDAPHVTADGHSYGLYEYQPTEGAWRDLTPDGAAPDQDWPGGREDFGFAFDSQAGDLVVFAGEGQGGVMLNDLWTYSEQAGAWTLVDQHYPAPGGMEIAPREIYNISADTHGHLYLFGGTYLAPPNGAGENAYANDLWRYDDATRTWSLLAGIPNGYDPTQPLPRHYFGQTVDATGDFDILGGYLDAPETPPFFAGNVDAGYAVPTQFAFRVVPGSFGLTDFWQFDPSSGWRDRGDALGAMAGSPMIPYVVVSDQTTGSLYTFGGFRLGQDGLLEPSNTLWSLAADDLGAPSPSATPSATAFPSTTPSATPTGTATRSPTAAVTATARDFPSVTPIAGATVVAAMTKSSIGSSVTKTLFAKFYKLRLVIGAREAQYSPAQVLARHPTGGEEILSGPQPTGAFRTGGPVPNRHVELSIYSTRTGKEVLNVSVAMAITTPGGRVLQRVPVLVLRRIAQGPNPWQFGNNLTLPKGHYHVEVHAGQVSATFDVLLSR